VTAVTFAPDGATVLSIGHHKLLRIWNVTDGKDVNKMGPTTEDLYGIAFSRDGNSLATIGYGGTITLWNLAEGKPAKTIHLKVVGYCITFAPDGKAVVTGHDRKRGTEEYACLITPIS